MIVVSRICCLCGRKFKVKHEVGTHLPEHCYPRCPTRSTAINHLLPRWEWCERHHEAFRDYRLHDGCPSRFATRGEITGR